MTTGLAVGVEVGQMRAFAWALEWPGWCRPGRDPDAALEALVAYRARYARVADRARLRLPSAGVGELLIAETVPGDATTDFGAPHIVATADRRRLDAAGARRIVALVDAAWAELDAVAAAAPASLRKGPRGGGRDRDAIVAHVAEAERAYGSRGGARVSAAEWRAGGVELLRDRLRAALEARGSGDPAAAPAWPPRYLARRVAWHALDHAWEIEDRAR